MCTVGAGSPQEHVWQWRLGGSGWERARAEWRRPVTRKRARFRPTGSSEGLGCWPAIPY